MHLPLNSQAFSWARPHPLRSYARNDPLARLMQARPGPFPCAYLFSNEEFLTRVLYTQRRELCHHKTLAKTKRTPEIPTKQSFESDNSRQRRMTISVCGLGFKRNDLHVLRSYQRKPAASSSEGPRVSSGIPHAVREVTLIVILKSQMCDQIFSAKVAESVFQLHQLNKNVVLRIKAGSGLRRLEIERQPLLNTLHAR